MTHEPTVVVTLRESDARWLANWLVNGGQDDDAVLSRAIDELKHALAECDCSAGG